MLVLGIPVGATTLHGSEFAEALKDNTVSGKAASGIPYNLYFLEGGQVTYADEGGHHDSGTWRINENGDICLRWLSSSAPVAGCFRVTIDGRGMTWTKGHSNIQFVLRGDVSSVLP
jgi:hypothetical protein